MLGSIEPVALSGCSSRGRPIKAVKLPWLIFFVLVRMKLPDPFLFSASLALICAGVFAFYRVGHFSILPDWVRLSSWSGSIAATLFTACVIIGALLATPFETRAKRRPRHPELLLFREILSATIRANLRAKGIETPRVVSANLENAARLLEYSIPTLLVVGDPVTDAWVRSQMRERAFGIRELNQMIMLSNPDEWPDEFVNRVTSAFMAASHLDWAALEHTEVTTLSWDQRNEKLSSRITRAMSAALLISSCETLCLIK
jgi:hypothetical protein